MVWKAQSLPKNFGSFILNVWLGLKIPLICYETSLPAKRSLIFYKNFITCEKNIIVFQCIWLLICRLNGNTTEWNLHANFKKQCKIGQKVIVRIWWEIELSPASRKHLTTFCRPFTHYAHLRLCSTIVNCIQNNCLYFVCYGWSAQALTALATLPISVCSMTELLHEVKNSSC